MGKTELSSVFNSRVVLVSGLIRSVTRQREKQISDFDAVADSY